MKNKTLTLYISLLVFLLWKNFIIADYRYYAWTYQFITMFPGETELEFYTRIDQNDISNPNTVKWKRQVEIETGLTKSWDLSFYLVDSYKPTDGKTKFDEIKIRTRYKLTEKDRFFVDTLAYIEHKIQVDRNYPDKWETKLILAKDIRDLNLSINIIPEEYYQTGTKNKLWKVKYAFGTSYPLNDIFRFGIESTGDLKYNNYMLGPAISFKGKRIWSAIGVLYGLNKESDDLQTQAIIGIVF
ncbi:MAG: hypothetical protein SNJ64_00660 [Endomicrobiia bacterium]